MSCLLIEPDPSSSPVSTCHSLLLEQTLLAQAAASDRFPRTLFSPTPRPLPHTATVKSQAQLCGSTMHLCPRPESAPRLQCQRCQRLFEDSLDQPLQPPGRDRDSLLQNPSAQSRSPPDTSVARGLSSLPVFRHEFSDVTSSQVLQASLRLECTLKPLRQRSKVPGRLLHFLRPNDPCSEPSRLSGLAGQPWSRRG